VVQKLRAIVDSLADRKANHSMPDQARELRAAAELEEHESNNSNNR